LKLTKAQLEQLVSEKNSYKQNLELTKAQLEQLDFEKNSYKQNWEPTKTQLEQLVSEKNSYKQNLELTKAQITNVPTIYIIYQYKYKNNVLVSGFGDFIRGCFFTLQFSEKYNIHFDFNIYDHPIKKYLNYFYLKEGITNEISEKILFFQNDNYKYVLKNNIINYAYYDIDKELLNTIKDTDSYNNDKYIYLINHPDENFISEKHKKKICELFQPTLELQTIVDNTLLSINLIKYKYIIVQVRMDDSSFNGNHNNFKNQQINYIINVINSIKINGDEELFLMSSNNFLKKSVLQKLPKIKTIFKDIIHIGEPNLNNDDSLINTLVDFYVMSYAKHIYSFSVYHHGSGFSKWCAKMYNIPYICFKI